MTMWHFISDHISEATGNVFVCQRRTAAHGGDTHECFVIRDDSRRFFVKVRKDDATRPLHCEMEGLQALESTDTVITPHVVCYGITEDKPDGFEYLVLNHIRFIDTPSDWHTMGAQLAKLHQVSQTQFGWSADNFIGASVQTNTWHSDWATFYAEYRIGSMLERLAMKGHKLTQADIFVTKVQQFLSSHHPAPSLVHGDLWSGNAGFCKKGPVLFDPAVYVGDRETDIAMTRLFGGFGPSFYEGYNAVFPLDASYPTRENLYQLYHVLNHALLFTGAYLSQAKSAIMALEKQF